MSARLAIICMLCISGLGAMPRDDTRSGAEIGNFRMTTAKDFLKELTGMHCQYAVEVIKKGEGHQPKVFLRGLLWTLLFPDAENEHFVFDKKGRMRKAVETNVPNRDEVHEHLSGAEPNDVVAKAMENCPDQRMLDFLVECHKCLCLKSAESDKAEPNEAHKPESSHEAKPSSVAPVAEVSGLTRQLAEDSAVTRNRLESLESKFATLQRLVLEILTKQKTDRAKASEQATQERDSVKKELAVVREQMNEVLSGQSMILDRLAQNQLDTKQDEIHRLLGVVIESLKSSARTNEARAEAHNSFRAGTNRSILEIKASIAGLEEQLELIKCGLDRALRLV